MKDLKSKTILWDFDGTLFDTYPMYTAIFLEFVKNTPYEKVYKELKVSFSHAANYFGLDEKTVRKMRALESTWPTERIHPFPGVEKVLKSVGTNVIMTHKIRRETERIIGDHGWMKYFTEIVAGDDGFPRKPDPASYRYLHEKYEIDLVVGDRLLDIIPAQKLGIKTCLYQNNEKGADFYISRYDEFFEKVAVFL